MMSRSEFCILCQDNRPVDGLFCNDCLEGRSQIVQAIQANPDLLAVYQSEARASASRQRSERRAGIVDYDIDSTQETALPAPEETSGPDTLAHARALDEAPEVKYMVFQERLDHLKEVADRLHRRGVSGYHPTDTARMTHWIALQTWIMGQYRLTIEGANPALFDDVKPLTSIYNTLMQRRGGRKINHRTFKRYLKRAKQHLRQEMGSAAYGKLTSD